jgi:hypothetical protein
MAIKLQAFTVDVSLARIMKSKSFREGFAEKRAGGDFCYDRVDWNYERGRQLAAAAPIDMPLLLPDRRLNPAAVALCESLRICEF